MLLSFDKEKNRETKFLVCPIRFDPRASRSGAGQLANALARSILIGEKYICIITTILSDVIQDDFSNQRCSNYVHQLQSKSLLNLLSNGVQGLADKKTLREHTTLSKNKGAKKGKKKPKKLEKHNYTS